MAVGNSQTLPINHIGQLHFSSKIRPGYNIDLKKVLFVLEITKNLLSVSQLIQDSDVVVEINSKGCFVKDKSTKEILLQGVLKDGLYKLIFSSVEGSRYSSNFSTNIRTQPIQNKTESIPIESIFSVLLNKTEATVVASAVKTPKCNASALTSGLLPSPKQILVRNWHVKLGHPCSNVLSSVLKLLNVNVSNFSLQNFCDACRLSKSQRLP